MRNPITEPRSGTGRRPTAASSAISPTIERLVTSFHLSLEAQNKAAGTISGYLQSVGLFVDYLRAHDLPTAVTAIERGHVEAFISDVLERRKPSTAATRYKGLRQFFAWCVDDDELDRSPMDKMKPPIVPEQPVPVLTDDELKALLKVCAGKTFEDRRDLAIISLLADTGIRRAECAHLSLEDVNLIDKRVTVLGKNRRVRTLAIGAGTARAIDRYLRIRDGHRLAEGDALWLGSSGRTFTDQGIRQMLERRGLEAGVKVHAHQFRHTFAHAHLANGGLEGDLMELAGWRSRQMLSRYASSTAAERARSNYRSPVDRLNGGGR